MGQDFFSPSGTASKFRAHLLLTAVLCIIHFQVSSLSELKIFDVQFPKQFLDWGIPTMVIWFSLNYFYYLYAEYTQWRADSIKDVRGPEGTPDLAWKGRTLVSEVQTLTMSRIAVQAHFSASKSYAKEKTLVPSEIVNDIRELMGHIEKQVMSAIKTDVARIQAFQSRIKRYNLANRLRFYVLDVSVPLLLVSVVVFFVIRTLWRSF